MLSNFLRSARFGLTGLKPYLPGITALLLVAILSLPVLCQIFLRLCENSISKNVTIETVILGEGVLKMAPEQGKALIVDISSLGLETLAEHNVDFRFNSPLRVLENGHPLTPHLSHQELRATNRGGFSHWAKSLYISPSTDTTSEPKQFVLIYPKIAPDGVAAPSDLKNAIWPYAFLLAFIMTSLSIASGAKAKWGEKAFYLLTLAILIGNQMLFSTEMINWGPINWNGFVFTPDSLHWIEPYSVAGTRPPVYPTIANLVFSYLGTAFNALDFSQVTVNARLDIPGHPLLAVVRVQKVIHALGALICATSLMRFIPPPCVTVLFAWLFSMLYIPHEYDHLLAETVAQACMFLIVAVYFQLIYKPTRIWLLLLGLTCALLFHTRSAGIYSLVIFGSGTLWFLAQGIRRNILTALLCSFLTMLLFAAPSLYRYFKTDLLSPAPMYADAQISFALQVARDRDTKLIKDEKAREFFVNAMKWRKEYVKDLLSKTTITSNVQLLGVNLYQVAHYVADQMKLDDIERRRIYLEVSGPILRKHYRGYFSLFLESFNNTVSTLTRLGQAPFPTFWALSLIMLVMALITWGPLSIFAFGLYAAHFGHVLVICLFDIPQPRYVYATEFMVLIGLMALVIGCLSRARQLIAYTLEHPPKALTNTELAR